MSSRAARIEADKATALQQFSCVKDLNVDGELVSFFVEGQEFTAVLPDVYGGSCDVYGPDDFEVSCTGSLVDIVAAVIDQLQGGEKGVESMDLDTSVTMETDAGYIQDTTPTHCEGSFPEMMMDIRELEAHGFSCVVRGALADAAFVTVSIPIPSCVAKSTADAWGLRLDLPLQLSCTVTSGHYNKTQRLESSFWQEKTTAGQVRLDAGMQLCNITNAYWSHICGTSATCIPEEHLECPPHLVEKKAVMLSEASSMKGVLLPVATYLTNRLPYLHEFCVICDEPLVFPPLLRPAVCTRTLCAYSARAFGRAITGDSCGRNASLEVWDLLVTMAICAGQMDDSRMSILFSGQNFPRLFLPGVSKPAFKQNLEGYKTLRNLLNVLDEYRTSQIKQKGIGWLNEPFKTTNTSDPLLVPLLNWIWESNRSYILALESEDTIQALGTSYQYALLSAPPEMESAFQQLKLKHGAEFCFHGSNAANWHCILRQGLKNASGTALMTIGARFVPGIYLARDLSASASYSSAVVDRQANKKARRDDASLLEDEVTGERMHDPQNLIVLAICEVAKVPSLAQHNNGTIWVCPEEAAVVTRFLLVYRSRAVPSVNLGNREVHANLEVLTHKLTQH